MMEVARGMANVKQNPRRRIVFIAFAGEELGSVGSKSYVHAPLFPLEKTVAMINFDMVGRLKNDKLTAIGASPPGHFSKLLDQINQRYGFKIKKAGVNPWSDDPAAFHAKHIPTLWFATGPDEAINTPADRPQRLNFDGMQRVSQFARDFLAAIAVDAKRPEYTKTTK